MRRTSVCFSSFSLGRRASAERPRQTCSTSAVEHADFLLAIDDLLRFSEHDDRAVVHRVMERRSRQHQAVEKRDRDAGVDAAAQRPQHSGRRRAVEVEVIADARVDGRDDDRPPFDDESDVADQRLVEDGVDRRSIVIAALRQTPDSRSLLCSSTILFIC